jgi:class 3 adenylate cyclase
MPFRVLVVEDEPGQRGLVSDFLRDQFRELPAEDWPPGWPSHRSIQLEVESLTNDEIGRLLADRARGRLDRHAGADALSHDVVITDLALSRGEGERLGTRGTDAKGKRDPTRPLDDTTGFQLLKRLAPQKPVIVTTFASNPRVVDACLNAGAHAVALKPANERAMAQYYFIYRNGAGGPLRWKRRQKKLGNEYGPRIDTYLRAVAHEVLKAVKTRALCEVQAAVPRQVPFWAAADRERLRPQRLSGTSLLLMDVRGFSRLVELGKNKPQAVFELMNQVWGQVLPILERYDGEVNNFVGDAALVFRGVYDGTSGTAELAETLECAREISRLFDSGGPVRTRLEELIRERYSELVDHDYQTAANMLAHVGGATFGVRVVSIEPDESEALYGRVGSPPVRWQHTVLSRFMNILARGESAIGGWEKDEELKFTRVDGESFLMRSRHVAAPVVPGFLFQSCEEFLGRPRDQIRDVPDAMEIYRALPQPAGDRS